MKTDLLEAHLEGSLDRDEAANVESALKNDKELREVYFQQVQMDAALRILFTGEAEFTKPEFKQGVMARLKSEAAGDDREFSKSVLTEILDEKEKIIPMRWPDLVRAAAVAAVAVLLVGVFMQKVAFNRGKPDVTEIEPQSENQEPASFLARVQSGASLVWGDKSENAVRKDGWVTEDLLILEKGVAEVAFNAGSRAFVEGPAKLSIESDNRAFLEYGKITAEVNPQSSGFTINTPRMNIVDISTRFGVSVDPENGETEVHVMQGEVEASRSSGNSVVKVIREGSAFRADARPLSSLEAIPYAGDQFELTAGKWRDPAPVIVYRFDESNGATLIDSGNRKLGGPYDLNLMDSGAFDQQPRRAPGLIGRSLVFEAGQTLATSLSSEFRLENAFTVSFWMKIPPRVGRRVNDYVVGLGTEENAWEIGCQNYHGGGRLITRFGNGFVVGSTDLADGKWHHVAVRFIGGEQVSFGSHVHLYVDGNLETLSNWHDAPIEPGKVGELRIGDLRNSGFPGWLDEFSIYSEAISTQTLQKLVTK